MARRAQRITEILLLALVYFTLGNASLLTSYPPGSVACAIWPASGVALAILLLRGENRWPGIWLGAWAINYVTLRTEPSHAILVGICIASASALQAVLGSRLLRPFINPQAPFRTATEVFLFAGWEAIVCIIAPSVSILVLTLSHVLPFEARGVAWITWWMGDFVGVLLACPLVLLFSKRASFKERAVWLRHRTELAIFFVLQLALGWVVYSRSSWSGENLPFDYMFLSFLFWGAFRFGQRIVMASTLLIVSLALGGTLSGQGPFSSSSLSESLLLLQMYVAFITLTGLVVSSVLRERDQTLLDLEESTYRFRALARNCPVGIFQTDQAGEYIYVNDRWSKLTGLNLAQAKDWLELIHTDDKSTVRERWRNALVARSEFSGEYRVARDGDEQWRQLTAVPLKGKDGQVTGFLGVVSDISEQKRAGRELARSNEELERFAYIASHDLQEPLRMISSYLTLIQNRYSGKLDASADEFITFAVEGARRMKALIVGLLQYSRVSTDERQFEQVAVPDVLAGVMAGLKVAVEESHAEVTWDALPVIQGNSVQVSQVFQNLIGNAIRYRGEAAPRIHISGKKESDRWVFCVKDNGRGIDAPYVKRVFDLFQRAPQQNDSPGMGLGLAVCKKIVERHGGKIWVESQVGKGSSFFFELREFKVPKSASA